MDKINIGILVLSDRASAGIYEDKSGKSIIELLKNWIINDINFNYHIIADDIQSIKDNLLTMSATCDLILTTGGTGPAIRDVTPEATEAICDKILPGFGELMRQESLKYVPTAILSRQIAGIKGKCLIINLPGQPKAIKECLEPIFAAVPYCIDLIGGNYIKTNEKFIKAFRPKK